MFQNAKTYETGLPDFHELVVRIMKLSYKNDCHTWSSIGTITIFQMNILKTS